MTDTNTIVQAVTEAQSSLSRINWTVVISVFLNMVGLYMTARLQRTAEVIRKDVNSKSSAQVAEIKELNKDLTAVEKEKSVLETRAEKIKLN